MKAIFDITVVDMETESVIAFSRELASSPQEAVQKTKAQLIEQGVAKEDGKYHVHCVAYAPLPGPQIVVPQINPAKLQIAKG